MNTHPLVQFPEEQSTSSTISSCLAGTDENRPQLLELRTESGTLYICPSKWQRLRLLWTFRHFHVLPREVLSRRDLHLIEKLSRSAVITPAQPVPRTAILGVVEKPRIKPMGSAPRVVTMRAERNAPTPPVSPLIPGLPSPGLHQRLFFDKPGAKHVEPAVTSRKERETGAPFRQWGAVGSLAAVCLLVIVAKFFVASPPEKSAQMTKPVAPAPVTEHAMRALPQAAPPPAIIKPPAIVKPRYQPAPPLPAATTVALHAEPTTISPEPSFAKHTSGAGFTKSRSFAPSAPDQRPFVAELPQGHFAAPVVADPNEVGELHLKALIAADGSVADVTVVSGDPKLAEAGIRAVRRWHYNPYEASATQSERETLINMRFFGQDAVTVTSVAR
jgi:hypothetical protein